MATDLERLLDLQNKDLALLEVDLRLRRLLEQVDRLDAEVASARLGLEESRKAHAAGTRRREEVEAKVDSGSACCRTGAGSDSTWSRPLVSCREFADGNQPPPSSWAFKNGLLICAKFQYS